MLLCNLQDNNDECQVTEGDELLLILSYNQL